MASLYLIWSLSHPFNAGTFMTYWLVESYLKIIISEKLVI